MKRGGTNAKLPTREELLSREEQSTTVMTAVSSSTTTPEPTSEPVREEFLRRNERPTAEEGKEEYDSSARNAERALRLLPSNLVDLSTQQSQDLETRSQCLILSFGDYERGVWKSALIYIFRLNWYSGDYHWVRNNYGGKYWPDNSQLAAVRRVNPDITEMPGSLIQAAGSLQAINKPAVVLAGFGTSRTAWNEVYEKHRDLIRELPIQFPDAMDEGKNITHSVNYVVRRIVGFDQDDDLYRFSAAMAFAKAETGTTPVRTPTRRMRAEFSPIVSPIEVDSSPECVSWTEYCENNKKRKENILDTGESIFYKLQDHLTIGEIHKLNQVVKADEDALIEVSQLGLTVKEMEQLDELIIENYNNRIPYQHNKLSIVRNLLGIHTKLRKAPKEETFSTAHRLNCYQFQFKNIFFSQEISLLIGSTANYTGDGPTKRYGCLTRNGINVVKQSNRYYVDEIRDVVIREIFPNSNIKIGDEVIKINQFYCEHLGNVAKYIDTTPITRLHMKCKITGEYYFEEVGTVQTEQSTNSKSTRKRKTKDVDTDNGAVYITPESNDITPTRGYGTLMMNLNGIYVVKQSLNYYIKEIYDDVFRNNFTNSNIKIGDEIIKINQFYCEHIGNVSKYIATTPIRSLGMKCKISGQHYFEEVNSSAKTATLITTFGTLNNTDNSSESSGYRILNSRDSAIHEEIPLPISEDLEQSFLQLQGNVANDALDSTLIIDRNSARSSSNAISTDGVIHTNRSSGNRILNSCERTIATMQCRQPTRARKKGLSVTWDYAKPCRYCDYVHLKGATLGQRNKCCLNGQALRFPFPQLQPLPPRMLHYARDRIHHMGRNSVSYNSVLCCAATGVENNEGGGFDVIHGDHAVRLHGRTYHFLPTSAGNGGLNFFTFDSLASCTEYATTTLNNTSKGYQRIIQIFLKDIYEELMQYNSICHDCEQIGQFAEAYMNADSTVNGLANINETTSYLDVAQITSNNATGNRIITFHRKGEARATSLSCTDMMWEPFIYPLLFFNGERGWGEDIRKSIKYMDYLIARLLCPEKIERNGEMVTLRVPNQTLDKFIRPIIRQQLGVDDAHNSYADEAYLYYAELFGNALKTSRDYGTSIKALLLCFCTELQNITQIHGFDDFCTELRNKLEDASLHGVREYIESYLELRRNSAESEEEIEQSLTEVCKFHMVPNLIKGRMVLLNTNRFQLMSRLSQTYLVDSVSRAIDYRLRFYRYHQKDLFGIDNNENVDGARDEGDNQGEKTFLSQSMHGSRRHLRSLAKNALALVSEYGRPSLFITLTCNPNWPEILEQLLPGQTAFDRGDIVCQVFFRKLQDLLTNIRQGKYFKIHLLTTESYKIHFEVRVIEYQKRGLPHAHIVIKFKDHRTLPRYEDKDALGAWIDCHIRAVYPSTILDEEPLEPNESYEEDIEYAEMVKSHMMHKCFSASLGGCKNENSVCSKGFDMNIVSDKTTFDERGFPKYRRPTIKSLNIVPHNKELLMDWNGHANVEYAGSTYTVIYLYKYLFKGSKAVKLRLTNADDVPDDDEITLYLRGRYLCSMDCYWRVLGHDTYPSPNPSVRIVKIIAEVKALATVADSKVPDIVVYFNRPSDLYHLKYTELFNAYTWNYKRPMGFVENRPGYYLVSIISYPRVIYLYKRSKEKISITRLETIAITSGELFFLRLILYNYPKQSYSDCKVFNDRTYMTYQEAAVAAGIVKDNDEVYSCFEEAAHFQDCTPAELRTLFYISTLQGFPTLRILKEEQFKILLYDDFLHNYNPVNHEAAWNDLLRDLSTRFESDGKNMRDYGLPEPVSMRTELEIERCKYSNEEQLQLYTKLCRDIPNTDEQQQIFNNIVNAVANGESAMYYIQGQAGSGKSTLAKKIMAYCRSLGKLCAGCASTGLAATVYEGFETAHSLFKFPVIEEDEREIDTPVECQLQNNSNRLQYLKEVNLILWDEFPSCDREVFEAAYRALNGFQNKVIVMMGDMRQIAPVVVNGEKQDIINRSIPSSPLWIQIYKKVLTTNMRLLHMESLITENSSAEQRLSVQMQREFGQMILAIGNGTHVPTVFQDGYVRDPTRGATTVELPGCQRIMNMEDAINFVFPPPFRPEAFCNRAILAGKNEDVDKWNLEVQQLNNFTAATLASHDELAESDDPYNILRSMLTDDVLNNYNNNGVPPHILHLKINDTCIVLRNLNKKEGLTNNTRVRVIAITSKCIRVQTFGEVKRIFSVPRIRFKFRLPFGRSFELIRTQFPLRLAYCISINKSQGQELHKCLLDLRSPPFAHGHLYVALSRVRRYTDIALFASDDNVRNGVVTTENIVYPELYKNLIN